MAKEDNNYISYLLYLFLGLVILAGMYFVFNYGSNTVYNYIFPSTPTATVVKISPSTSPSINNARPVPDCPNVLIRKGNLLLLINTYKPPEDGVNPMVFNHLDDYILYIKTQREIGVTSCPILFLQEESNAQGENVYRVRPGPFDQQGGTQPGPAIKLNEIAGIQQFFGEAPGASKSNFVDSAAPSAFNKGAIKPNTDVKTTMSTSALDLSLGPRGPIPSNNGKLTRVENISTDDYTSTLFNKTKPAELSSPMGITSYMTKNPLKVVETMDPVKPISTPLSNSVSISPQITGTSQPIATQYNTPMPVSNPGAPIMQLQPNIFNGSLGPYYGPPIASISTPPANISKTVTPYTDASRDDPPYNQNNYIGFDPHGQFIGKYTNIDVIHDSTKNAPLSDNPMDPNWGGVIYTRNQVYSGKYADNAVTKPIYGVPPNVMAIPSLMKDGGPPIYVTPTVPIEYPTGLGNSTRVLRSADQNA